MKPRIEIIAVNYTDTDYNRSCANCAHGDKKDSTLQCAIHDLPTNAGKKCGVWNPDKKTREANPLWR